MTLKKWERIIVYALLLAFLVVFSFSDQAIMERLYDQTNVFGRLGENLGEVPFQLLCVYSSLLLIKFRPRNRKSMAVLFVILGIVLTLFFAGYGGGMVYSYLKRPAYGFGAHLWVAVVVAVVYLFVGVLLTILTKTNHPETAFSFALLVVTAYFVILGAMNLFKLIWSRPRWRFLIAYANNDAAAAENYFMPWYLPHTATYLFGGTFDDYASFPSGHTMNALGIIFLSLSPSFLDVYRNKAFSLRLCAYLWAGLIALSRTIMGAHFSSDVTAGFALTLILFDLTSAFLWPRLTSFVAKRYSSPLPSTVKVA